MTTNARSIVRQPAIDVIAMFWELKTQGGRVTPEQNAWLSAIVRAEFGQARVVRPMDLLRGDVQTWLRALR